MPTEVRLREGWLMRDVRRASERLTEWATSRTDRGRAESTDGRGSNTIGEERGAPLDVRNDPPQ
jgi:hypothetical protein